MEGRAGRIAEVEVGMGGAVEWGKWKRLAFRCDGGRKRWCRQASWFTDAVAYLLASTVMIHLALLLLDGVRVPVQRLDRDPHFGPFLRVPCKFLDRDPQGKVGWKGKRKRAE